MQVKCIITQYWEVLPTSYLGVNISAYPNYTTVQICCHGNAHCLATGPRNLQIMTTYCTLGVVGVERFMSETARRTSKGRKIGAWCICDAPKARPAGPSPHLGCVFVQRRRKRQMARPEGPSRCFGYCSFVEDKRSSGEARRAEPPRPFLVASDQKRQILALVFSL